MLAAPVALGACRKREGEPERPAPDSAAPRPVAGENASAFDSRPALPTAEPIVRVRIMTQRALAHRLQIGAGGRWIELTPVGRDESTGAAGGPSRYSAMLHAPIDVGVGPGGWSVLDGRGFRAPIEGMEVLQLRAVGEGEGLMLEVGGRRYPGALRLVPRSDAAPEACDVVNHVALEQYLPGVLSRELYSHWHPETHAAQAVAARSFACTEHAFFSARRHFDLTDTAASQAYGGGEAHRRAVEAVEMTRGLMLAWNDRLVPGYYSSCCGGPAADARDAIGEHPYNDVPPLRGRSGTDVCTGAPLFSWVIERPLADLLRRMRAYGEARSNETLAQITTLRRVEAASRNAHGRPRTYTVRTARGVEVELEAEELRRIVDYDTDGVEPPEKPLWSSNVQVTISRRTVRFDGHGHGHGAGLCQHGAEALARMGEEYRSILEWYYPQAEPAHAYA